jgi:hypothetical protein
LFWIAATGSVMRRNSNKRLAVEALERRDLMATGDPYVIQLAPSAEGGNVTAEVIEGTLFIRGDAKGNQVQLFGHGNGIVSIQGLNSRSTVNEQVTGLVGCQAKLVTVEGVVNGITVEMGDGDDIVWLDGSMSDVLISTSGGNDEVIFGGVDVHFFPSCMIGMAIHSPTAAMIEGDLTINTGDGNDTIQAYAIVTGDADIRSCRGDDVFAITPSALYSFYTFQVVGRASVDAGPDQSPTNSLPANIGQLLIGWDLIGYGIPFYPHVERQAVAAFLILDAVQSRVTPYTDDQVLTFDDLDVLGWPIPQLRGDSSILLNIRFAPDDSTFLSRAAALGIVPYATAEHGGEIDAWVTHEQVLGLKDLAGLEQASLQARAIVGPLPLLVMSADVNGDGIVAANDALIVIDALNHGNDVPLSVRTDIDVSFLVDVDRDGELTAADALKVINVLNARADSTSTNRESMGEGEAGLAQSDPAAFLLAIDSIFDERGTRRHSKPRGAIGPMFPS